MYFQEAISFATEYRKELSPMMNKMGFRVSVTTFKEYYDEGKVIVKIKKVPKDFPVWSSVYSRYDFTPQAKKIETAISNRLENIKQERDIELSYEILFDRNIPYIELNNNREEN